MILSLAENSIQLVPDGTLFLHILLIILMIFILNITLFKPINRILQERDRQTQGRLGEAQAVLKRVQSNLEQYEQALRLSRTEGYHLLEKQRALAMHERQGLLNSLREELQVSTEEQKRLIQIQAGQARLQLDADSHRIAEEVSQQILRRPLNGNR